MAELRRAFARLPFAEQRTFARHVKQMADLGGAEDLCHALRAWAGNPPRPCKVNPFRARPPVLRVDHPEPPT